MTNLTIDDDVLSSESFPTFASVAVTSGETRMGAIRAMAKSVCIVGAGPAGIQAAKTLLHDFPKGFFSVTVFEKSKRIGGLWPLSITDDGMVNPDMCTNVSRHTVSFGDMAWPESSPSHPKAWEVGQYLNGYVSRYGGIDIRTSHEVVKVSRAGEILSGNKRRWAVEVVKTSPYHSPSASNSEKPGLSKETQYFDHLIVASGFFGKAKLPSNLPSADELSTPIQHSSQFRSIKDLLEARNKPSPEGTKIVVVGGSMSGAEVAASIAMQLSSEKHSPKASQINNASKYRVFHITARPFWALPLFLPSNPTVEVYGADPGLFNPAPSFLPLDLVLFNLTSRPHGEVKNSSGQISEEAAILRNEMFQSYVGSDQGDLVSTLSDGIVESVAIRGEVKTLPPWIAISDQYAEFVRSGEITPNTGRVTDLRSKGTSAVFSSEWGEKIIDDVAAIVFATGFENTKSLSFLPGELLQTLEHDPNCSSFPLVLNVHGTVSRKVPELGFVGFYRGPYWGIFEQQARFLGKLWRGDKEAENFLAEDISPILDLRKCFYEFPERLSQYPMGDYVYIMESFNGILCHDRIGDQAGFAFPSRYQIPMASDDQRQESAKAISIVEKIQKESEKGLYVAKAIFRSLQGNWKVDRSLISSVATYPSGKFHGTAKFSPRCPDPEHDAEYLYLEEGDFETEQGLQLKASRRYAHRYQRLTDTISVWFIAPDNKSVDYLFHKLTILPPSGHGGWRATSCHLCSADTYDVEYEFYFRGVSLEWWTMKYQVRGPSKDYRIESMYRR